MADITNLTVGGINYTITDSNALRSSEKGANSGVATLGADGKVPSNQLPSFVDDVIEAYYYNGKMYSDEAHTSEITGEGGKIYVDLTTNKTYRYSGSAFVDISSGGSVVTVTQTLTSGTEIAGITVDGTETKLYAPAGTHGTLNGSYDETTDTLTLSIV